MRSQTLARRGPSGRGCRADRRCIVNAEIGVAERMNTLRLALRMLGRDWHAGELRALIAALVLAGAGVGTGGFFTRRVTVAWSRRAEPRLGRGSLPSAHPP